MASMKRLARKVRREKEIIKIEGLKQFIGFANSHGFIGRLRIAYKILFKVMK